MKKLSKATCLALSLVSLMALAPAAFAVQKNITITATVDDTLDIALPDGSALPSTMSMVYLPGIGLKPTAPLITRIFSNDRSKSVQVRLAYAPVLINTLGSGSSVPLTVTYGTQTLSTTNVTLAATEIYPGTATGAGASLDLPLVVSQTASGTPPVRPLLATGSYSGVVSIVTTLAP